MEDVGVAPGTPQGGGWSAATGPGPVHRVNTIPDRISHHRVPATRPGPIHRIETMSDPFDRRMTRTTCRRDTRDPPHERLAKGCSGEANPEKRDPVTQKPHRALDLIGSHPAVFARQGSVVATWRSYGGRRLGPYYRLVYREEGRQRTVYLGRAGELVDRVRAALAKLQRPIRERRRLARIGGQIRVSLRREKARLGMILRRWGLYLKGFELRGGRGRLERGLSVPPRRLPRAACPPASAQLTRWASIGSNRGRAWVRVRSTSGRSS